MPALALSIFLADLGRMQGLLARGTREDVREARRLASALRSKAEARRKPRAVDERQAPLPVVSVDRDFPFYNCPIAGIDAAGRPCPMRAITCVARQIASELEVGKGPAVRRSSPAKRGRLASFVQCRTELCAIGAGVRMAIGDVPEAVAAARKAPRCSDTSS